MSVTVNSTLMNGNKSSPGKKPMSRTKHLLEMQLIGEENCRELYQMQVEAARKGNLEAGQFLLNKFLPNAKGVRMINLPLPILDSIESIQNAEQIVVSHICEGIISVEEGERLINIIKNSRETFQTTEVMAKIAALEEKMKDHKSIN
jgi:hypothetical protein